MASFSTSGAIREPALGVVIPLLATLAKVLRATLPVRTFIKPSQPEQKPQRR